jgi:hypothetical protein
MAASDDLSVAWAEAQARLPTGWSLDGLSCASTGLSPAQRSDDWVAVAVGPGAVQREARAADPMAALAALTASFEPDAGGDATMPAP